MKATEAVEVVAGIRQYSGESFSAAAAVNVLFPVGVDHGKKSPREKEKL